MIYVFIYFFSCNYSLYCMDTVNPLSQLPASFKKSDHRFFRLCKAMTQLKIGKAEEIISRHPDIVKKYGICPLGGDMITPLIYLSRAEVWDGAELLHVLLKAGADPNAADSNGNTFLHSTQKHIHAKHLAYLLKFGVNIDQKNKMGRTPSMQHALYDSDIKEDLLRLSGAINAQDNDGKTVLHQVYQSGMISYYIEKLIQRIDKNNYDELICIHEVLHAIPTEEFMRKLESCDDYTKSLLCSIRNWRGIVFMIKKEQQRRKRERKRAIKDFIITSISSHMTEIE